MIFKFSHSTLEGKYPLENVPNQLNTKYLKNKLVLGAGLEPAQALLPTGF